MDKMLSTKLETINGLLDRLKNITDNIEYDLTNNLYTDYLNDLDISIEEAQAAAMSLSELMEPDYSGFYSTNSKEPPLNKWVEVMDNDGKTQIAMACREGWKGAPYWQLQAWTCTCDANKFNYWRKINEEA